MRPGKFHCKSTLPFSRRSCAVAFLRIGDALGLVTFPFISVPFCSASAPKLSSFLLLSRRFAGIFVVFSPSFFGIFFFLSKKRGLSPPQVGNILTEAAARSINLILMSHLYLEDLTHSPLTFSNLSPLNLVSIFRCPSPPRNPVCVRSLDPSVLSFSLPLHRHPYICLSLIPLFISNDKHKKYNHIVNL